MPAKAGMTMRFSNSLLVFCVSSLYANPSQFPRASCMEIPIVNPTEMPT